MNYIEYNTGTDDDNDEYDNGKNVDNGFGRERGNFTFNQQIFGPEASTIVTLLQYFVIGLVKVLKKFLATNCVFLYLTTIFENQ